MRKAKGVDLIKRYSPMMLAKLVAEHLAADGFELVDYSIDDGAIVAYADEAPRAVRRVGVGDVGLLLSAEDVLAASRLRPGEVDPRD